MLTGKRAIARLRIEFCRGSGRLPAKLCCPSPMRPMLRKPDETRSGAGTSEGAPEGADHSIASRRAFVRCAAACVES